MESLLTIAVNLEPWLYGAPKKEEKANPFMIKLF